MPEEKQQILAQAAESIIIKQGDCVLKKRIVKGYRLPVLDEKLRKLRTRSEAKIIEKLSKKINVPKIISVDEKNKEILMSFIPGKKLSDSLESLDWRNIAREIGQEVAKIHDSDIIHGDLTTSNMIYADGESNKQSDKDLINNKEKSSTRLASSSINRKNNREMLEQEESIELKIPSELASEAKVFFIDFGLGYHSARVEDKAVDLHLLRQALEAKHFTIWQECFKIILDNYSSKDKDKVLLQLKKVEARGRYKH